ncbi:MAG: DNA polymerase III subunit beta [Deltaproteobacteria bacterium]|nr:DNA polymerase III subunit beta [Deltaproteobacteria bacterium]
MKFKINREELKQTLARIYNVVERKTTKPILSNALIKCQSNELIICGTDLEVGLQIKLEAQVEESGEIAVPAKSLYDIVRELSSEQVHFELKEEAWLEILAGRSKFKVAVLPAKEFPSMPEVPSEGSIHFESQSFQEMITKTLFAVSTDETKYNINGVYLSSPAPKQVRMVATDGHRLSYEEKPMIEESTLPDSLLLPRKGVLEIQKLLADWEGPFPFYFEGRNAIVQTENTTLFIRLIEGEFPKYQQIIPKENHLMASVSKEQLIGAIRRVSLLSPEHHRGIKFVFSSGNLELLCSNPNLGEAREEVECEYKGKHLEIGFNFRYMLDVLGVMEDEKVQIALKDEVSPCLIRSESDPGFLSLVMPMRL